MANLTNYAEFSLGQGKSLIISLSSGIGLDRIVIEHKKGIVRVRVTGHFRFEFSNKKQGLGTCDFWLANPSTFFILADYLEGKFLSQFTWGVV